MENKTICGKLIHEYNKITNCGKNIFSYKTTKIESKTINLIQFKTIPIKPPPTYRQTNDGFNNHKCNSKKLLIVPNLHPIRDILKNF